jgi:hypothetical protein
MPNIANSLGLILLALGFRHRIIISLVNYYIIHLLLFLYNDKISNIDYAYNIYYVMWLEKLP